ncbi:MAG: cobalt-precorrin 5A hydrolase [Methanomassiliicoccales archaeon]
MRTVVVHASHEEAAVRVARALGADTRPLEGSALEEAFQEYEAVVAIMAVGIVLRKLCPLLKDKWRDAAVVVVTPDMRFAIPLLGGHHGANRIARQLSSLGMIPVISTATDALGRESVEELAYRFGADVVNRSSTLSVNSAFLKGDVPVYAIHGPAMILAGEGVSFLVRKGRYCVGIGCNRGVTAEEVREAVSSAFQEAKISQEDVFAYATTERKQDEKGLVQGVRLLGGNLLFLDDETLNSQQGCSSSKAEMIGLKGVAEPAALAISRHKRLVLERRARGNVTVAIAE